MMEHVIHPPVRFNHFRIRKLSLKPISTRIKVRFVFHQRIIKSSTGSLIRTPSEKVLCGQWHMFSHENYSKVTCNPNLILIDNSFLRTCAWGLGQPLKNFTLPCYTFGGWNTPKADFCHQKLKSENFWEPNLSPRSCVCLGPCRRQRKKKLLFGYSMDLTTECYPFLPWRYTPHSPKAAFHFPGQSSFTEHCKVFHWNCYCQSVNAPLNEIPNKAISNSGYQGNFPGIH